MTELAALASDRGIKLSADIPESNGLAEADHMGIRRVLLNLLGNALKFTNTGGTISVTGSETNSLVIVSMKDTGIGISKEDQNRLFQKYYKGSRGRRYIDGTGLGLYLCKQIINNHQGDIFVDSVEGEGSTFTVKLPKGQ